MVCGHGAHGAPVEDSTFACSYPGGSIVVEAPKGAAMANVSIYNDNDMAKPPRQFYLTREGLLAVLREDIQSIYSPGNQRGDLARPCRIKTYTGAVNNMGLTP